jgi:hypothetical protein
LHDALKCEDAAEPDIRRRRAEVGDGGVIPVGDLSLLGYLELGACCPYGKGCENQRDDGGQAGQRGYGDLYPVTRRPGGRGVPIWDEVADGPAGASRDVTIGTIALLG